MSKANRTSEKKRQAKARRQQRKRDMRRESVRALWDDREHQARPTKERIGHGVFALEETDAAGVRYAKDRAATMLDRLQLEGRITPEQCQGGQDFAALLERTRLVSKGRSCIDFEVVGHEGDDDAPSPQELTDNRDREELYLACGMFTWAELRRVCDEGQKPSDMERLRKGLNLCVEFWGKGLTRRSK